MYLHARQKRAKKAATSAWPPSRLSGSEDPQLPASTKAFFYLVEYFDGTASSYGTETASKPRAPGPGACSLQ